MKQPKLTGEQIRMIRIDLGYSLSEMAHFLGYKSKTNKGLRTRMDEFERDNRPLPAAQTRLLLAYYLDDGVLFEDEVAIFGQNEITIEWIEGPKPLTLKEANEYRKSIGGLPICEECSNFVCTMNCGPAKGVNYWTGRDMTKLHGSK